MCLVCAGLEEVPSAWESVPCVQRRGLLPFKRQGRGLISHALHEHVDAGRCAPLALCGPELSRALAMPERPDAFTH